MTRRRSGSASVKDVAQAAGVSVGTVSNVLNRPELVARQTRERVQTVMRELGFVRNEAARHLRSGSSRAVGLVVLDAANPFFTTVMRGVEDVVGEHGDVVLVGNSAGVVHREMRYLDLFEQQRVRGVLLAPTQDMPDLNGMNRQGIPVVCLDRHLPDAGYPSVSVDDVEGGRLAARHLVELGHREVLFAGGPGTLQQVHDRRAGFREVVEGAGGRVHTVPTEALTVAAGRAVGASIDPQAAGSPTAVFAANDLVAIGVLNDLVSRGLRVPEDLSIVGFDDIDFAATATIPITTIDQPAYDMGRAGATLLYDELDTRAEGGDATPLPATRQRRFIPTLVVRDSTAAPRRVT